MEYIAYHSEWERQMWRAGEVLAGCITYPVSITDDHATASYGQYVILIDGDPYGPADMPPGELQVPDPAIAEGLRAQGYAVVEGDVATDYAAGVPLAAGAAPIEDQVGPVTHWHPDARVVQY